MKRNCGVAECDDHNRNDKVCAKENAAINASKRLTVPVFKATGKVKITFRVFKKSEENLFYLGDGRIIIGGRGISFELC